ncbi:hypothetical protein TanjilG_01434 [Lupinus angustifolius]|uniref:uncharacterized protein LOC109335685 n=1 Tax=Lupinus angustifolius TaxID=3871 RepID=UPI00090DABCC|nr:PREDICTED: uncharacterized protein LOC109335685 [Lupinus angustifolius]OIV90238.1 hypothetical protein TanjilG_01434 [Lupinus angustifolius]
MAINIILNPCQPLSCTSLVRGNILKKNMFPQHLCLKERSGSKSFQCESKRNSTFNHKSSNQNILRELPEASFDEYLEEKGRIIRIIFPGKFPREQLNEEKWKVSLTPVEALFLTCQPVIHLTARCTSDAENYPPEVSRNVTKIFEVQVSKCEFQKLPVEYAPKNFKINCRGAIYLERQRKNSWMKNQLDFKISLDFPPLLAWVPEYVLQGIIHTVLKSYINDINNGLALRLLEDYNSYKRNHSKNSA